MALKSKKKKPKSMARLINDAAVLLQKLVRMKAAGDNGAVRCVTCPELGYWKEMQGGRRMKS